ncbi:hypothetical protein [Thiorhodovibrio frisius]|nr:hypothetical protein [Thiorhodovibrio frisius]WPL23453.1 hypothetical protein Thiofri_03638 [Thiorhodovibrio frisius]
MDALIVTFAKAMPLHHGLSDASSRDRNKRTLGSTLITRMKFNLVGGLA